MNLNSILTWITAFFDSIAKLVSGPDHFTGVLDDPRSAAAKSLDWLHEERVLPAAASSDPYGNPKITESPYPYLNQNSTSSCVPHGVGLALAIERHKDEGSPFIAPAPLFMYRQRSNYPAEGTYIPEAFALMRHQGLPPQSLMPTPQTEAQANAAVIRQDERNEAAPYAGKAYFTLETPNDIDAIARTAALGHGVPICLFATYKEYAQLYPQIIEPGLSRADAEVQHEVCVLPSSGFYENGVKYVTIQDSAWFGGFKLRYLSESFIRSRVTAAGYWDSVEVTSGAPRPKYHFTQTLKVGSQGEEVRQMQLLLIAEGLLPADCATGYFGGLTLAGVRLFQNKYAGEILTPLGLFAPSMMWGQKCITKANALCS